MTTRVLLLFLLLSMVLIPAPVPAQSDVAESLEESRKELREMEERMEGARDRVRSSERKERSVLGELEELDREIALLKEKINLLRGKEQEQVVAIRKTESSLDRIRKERDEARKRLVSRSEALYKAGNVSYLKVIFGSTGFEDLGHRLFYLKKVARYDSDLFRNATDLFNLEKQHRNRLLDERTVLISTRKDLESDLTSLSRRKRSRDLLLASVRNEKEKYSRLAEELENSSQRLIRLIEALQRQAETGDSPFSMLKGALKSPVSGKIIVDFGKNRNDRFNTYTLSRGVTIRSAEGTPVRSVFKGKALYADWFRGYGRIIILDHGGGYYTLYGHLSAIHVEVGQEVDTDEVIGLAGDSGSLEGAALYFEIRKHGKPLDPKQWFAEVL
ncbi:MAG: peptidoglycan DD-metalloendopeptidase family protein [bacterium]|nr:MAG: peptidoglycan DD-metalloendopeptidase family protein [bacterium]